MTSKRRQRHAYVDNVTSKPFRGSCCEKRISYAIASIFLPYIPGMNSLLQNDVNVTHDSMTLRQEGFALLVAKCAILIPSSKLFHRWIPAGGPHVAVTSNSTFALRARRWRNIHTVWISPCITSDRHDFFTACSQRHYIHIRDVKITSMFLARLWRHFKVSLRFSLPNKQLFPIVKISLPLDSHRWHARRRSSEVNLMRGVNTYVDDVM